jgi:hypothetical protein
VTERQVLRHVVRTWAARVNVIVYGMASCAFRAAAVGASLAVLAAGCGSTEERTQSREGTRPEFRPVVSATIPIGDTDDNVEGVAAGEGAIWVAAAAHCSGSVSRVDPESNEVAAKVPTDIVYDLAVGSGAVWAVGEVCGEGPTLFRIDPRTNAVVATIPLDRPSGARTREVSASGVAVGESSVWVSLSFDPRTGEVVRIDPSINEVVARISTRGYAGELTVGSGSVWVFSHPEYTDETDKGTSLNRIDPQTNELVATPLRGERFLLGGDIIPPLIAVGEDEVWIHSLGEASPRGGAVAIRVDARTNEVTREPLPVDRFFPFAVAEGGVWFIGPRTALSRLNPRTLEVDESVKLEVTVGDAAFDPATRSFWIADPGGSVVRVDLR